MRWWIAVPALLVACALDRSLMSAFSVGGLTPSLVPVVLAFVGLYASREAAFGAALLAGFLLDTASPGVRAVAGGVDAIPVLGPHMLGCAAAMWGLLETRAWLYRRNLATLAVAAAAFAVGASLGFLAVAGVRAAYADPEPLWGAGRAAGALGRDALDAIATGVVAIPVGWLLERSVRFWGFATAGQRFVFESRTGRANG